MIYKMDSISKYLATMALMMTVSSMTLYAEPSVYGFGSNDTTPSRQSSSSSKRSIASMQQKIAQQDERIDGLITIIEGLSASLNELQMREVQGSSVNTNRPNDDLLKKLAGMIDEINANYVSKEELQALLGKKQFKAVSKKKTTTKKSTVKSSQKGKNSLANKSNATLYSEGVRFFVKKRYTEAQKRFAITDTQRYKPAASNYYLGEIAYYTKKYEDAIFYFKKSAGLYDKASYIDTLLLHTAVSLEKSGDKGQAKAFYENIIANYKGKKSAKIAKERLKKL